MTDELEYLSHRLVIIEQPGGGFLVEATPIAGAQTIRTMTYQRTQEAIAAANGQSTSISKVGDLPIWLAISGFGSGSSMQPPLCRERRYC
ncbi:hypothetical protein ACQPTN_35000 [Bradyrhizobium sp. 13971]